MKYDFDQCPDRADSECKKYDRKSCPADVTPMWIADSDFMAPPEVTEALRKRIAHCCYGYPADEPSFEAAAAGWVDRRHGWRASPEWVQYGYGVISLIGIAIRAFSHPGDKVVIQTPVYPPFHAIVKNNGRQLVENPLSYQNGAYRIDFEDLERKLQDPRVKLLLLCNPHNPVMRCFTKEELRKVSQLCAKHSVFVLSDEVHGDLVYPGHQYTPFCSVDETSEQNGMVLINPSKTFNVAGFYVAAAIVPNDKRREAMHHEILNCKCYSRPIFSTVAFVTAYTECDAYVDALQAYLRQNRDDAIGYLKEFCPQILVPEMEATFLLWMDCRALGLEQKALNRLFLEDAKVLLNDGSTFGQGGAGFMRMNIACPKKTLEQVLPRIARAINAAR